MINKRRHKIITVLLIISVILVSNLHAIEKSSSRFGSSHFLGGRFGAWTMTTADPVLDSLTDFSNGALYAEFFYDHRIAPFISAEVSIGIFSQGELEYDSGTQLSTGAAKLYPVFVSAKVYPFSKYRNFALWPYLRLGGGIVHGTRDVTSQYYGDPRNYYIEENETKITYSWGFGIDWPLADQIGLNIDFKSTPVLFKKSALAGLKDYSGWSLTIGVGYIIKSK